MSRSRTACAVGSSKASRARLSSAKGSPPAGAAAGGLASPPTVGLASPRGQRGPPRPRTALRRGMPACGGSAPRRPRSTAGTVYCPVSTRRGLLGSPGVTKSYCPSRSDQDAAAVRRVPRLRWQLWRCAACHSTVTGGPAQPSRRVPGAAADPDGQALSVAGLGGLSPAALPAGMGRRMPAAPASHAAGSQAVTACLRSLLVTWMLRGLAASWTGMVKVSTPAA